MSKSRRKVAEEEAKKEGLTPTSDLEVDESKLSEDEKPHFLINWKFIIFMGIIVVLMIVCLIVIYSLGGPIKE